MIPLIKTSLSQTKPLFLFNGIYLWCLIIGHSDVRNRGDETAAIPVCISSAGVFLGRQTQTLLKSTPTKM